MSQKEKRTGCCSPMGDRGADGPPSAAAVTTKGAARVQVSPTGCEHGSTDDDGLSAPRHDFGFANLIAASASTVLVVVGFETKR